MTTIRSGAGSPCRRSSSIPRISARPRWRWRPAIDRQKEFLGRLGLLKAPNFELPEIGAPLVPSPWHPINAMTIAFGQGISVSPLQMVDRR